MTLFYVKAQSEYMCWHALLIGCTSRGQKWGFLGTSAAGSYMNHNVELTTPPGRRLRFFLTKKTVISTFLYGGTILRGRENPDQGNPALSWVRGLAGFPPGSRVRHL